MYLWHVPALYEAAIENPIVHLIEHVSFFSAGVAVWWPLIEPVPMRRGLKGLTTIAYAHAVGDRRAAPRAVRARRGAVAAG
jgi:cytochrome c oxidase assembly factor CtaG